MPSHDPAQRPADDAAAVRAHEVRLGHLRGWRYIPLNGKIPIQSDWTNAAPATLDQQLRFADLGNIGLRTGTVTGVVVIDDDTQDQHAADALGLPETVTVITGSGNHQYYFRAPDVPLANSVSKLATDVDVRGDGGQVVAVGSIHPDTGGMYRWADGLSPEEIELAPLPESILAQLATADAPKAKGTGDRRRAKAAVNGRRAQSYGDAALRRACEDVGRAPKGTRNDTLNRAAFSLGRLVAGGLLDRGLVEDGLSAAAAEAGLGSREIAATLRGGLKAGEVNPFTAEDIPDRDPQPQADCAPHTETSVGQGGLIEIEIRGGLLPSIVDQGEDALLRDRGDALYQREQLLVRVVLSASGVLVIFPVEPPFLVERLTEVARWFRVDQQGVARYVDCPARIANTYLARVGRWRVPVLRGVLEAPTLREDGSLLVKPGYDPESQLYLNSHGLELPEIPAEPDRAAAVTALELLKDLLKDFPFVADCDRSAALATILTALIRKALPTAPMFAFRAPKMGSGKSLLADVVARIATGRVAEVMSQGKDEEEDNKRILTVLMEGTAVVCIDNVERPFGGAAYCSVLTQETYKGRVLGVSRTATVPTRTLWIATGNNLVFVGDITTRVVVCDLDPKVERPEEREFDRNLHQYVAENRGALVAAGLTVLRAYHVAGRPRQKLKPFGRFERWSDWVRSALVWLGEADPCAGRVRIDQVDPVREQLVEFLHAWREAFGDTAMSAAQALEHAEQNDTDVGHRLGAALRGACDGRERADARRLGMWLQRHAGRIEDGLKIVRAGDKQGTALWRVDRAGAR